MWSLLGSWAAEEGWGASLLAKALPHVIPALACNKVSRPLNSESIFSNALSSGCCGFMAVVFGARALPCCASQSVTTCVCLKGQPVKLTYISCSLDRC